MFGKKTAETRAHAANAEMVADNAQSLAWRANENAEYAAKCATDVDWKLFKMERRVAQLEAFTVCAVLILGLAIRALAAADGE